MLLAEDNYIMPIYLIYPPVHFVEAAGSWVGTNCRIVALLVVSGIDSGRGLSKGSSLAADAKVAAAEIVGHSVAGTAVEVAIEGVTIAARKILAVQMASMVAVIPQNSH